MIAGKTARYSLLHTQRSTGCCAPRPYRWRRSVAESVSTLFPREVVSSKRRQTLGQWHCATSQKTQITIIIKKKSLKHKILSQLCCFKQSGNYRGAVKSLARPGRKQATEILMFIYPIYNHNWRNISTIYIYRGADKSLARPGKKQATATEDFDVHISYL